MIDHNIYYNGASDVCPVCGGRIKHPYTGMVTSEQLEEDEQCCIWMEVCDEGDGCLGYTPICKNVHPYTKEEENNEYVHYDVLEILNSSQDLSLENKLDLLNKLIKISLGDNVEGTYSIVVSPEGKIERIEWLDSIKEITLNLTIDEQGNIVVTK